MNEKVLVAIPLYNKKKFIINTINSVLKQKYKNYKIWILDNKSQDNSKKLIKKKFGKLLKNKIRYQWFNKHVSLRDNFQRILEYKRLNKYKYLKILCADDCLHKDYLYEAVSKLDSTNDEFFGFNSNLIYKNKNKKLYKRQYGFFGFEKIFSILFYNKIGCPSTIMLKTKFLKNQSFPKNYIYSGDLLFLLKFYARNKRIIFSKKNLVYFELGDQNTETNQLYGSKSMIDDRYKMKKKIIPLCYNGFLKMLNSNIVKIILYFEILYFKIFNYKLLRKYTRV